jgi:hypothetical protein
LKVLVNGNSFYYGRALLSYNPYVTSDEITVNRTFVAQDLIQASQKPHLLLDPTSSQGGEMLLPFIWPENYLDITKAGWPDNMGEIDIHDFDVLQHANGGTDPITISVFCWAENLTLAVPTTNAAQGHVEEADLDEFGFPKPYDKQAGSKQKKQTMKASNTSTNDEFLKDGLISKPASAVAKAADTLAMIPVLAPYAKATSMVASKLGAVARIFGYSRPQIMEDTKAFVPRYAGNLCNSDAPESLVKLTLDSKNELSIDTRLMGLGGEDELTVNSICQRWSYWRSFDWPETAVADDMLSSMIVAPLYGTTLVAAPVTEIHSTALAFGASPFDAWQGSIKFRFNVVCSEYHRGRLRIVYNPATNPAGAIPFNQVYSTVIDISENRDFEYEVKWADIRAWARNVGIDGIPAATIHDDVNPVTAGGTTDNGSITVYVVNELATPSTTAADVKVQVWVKAGDDFAVAVPTTKNLSQLSVFEQQSETAPALATSEDTSNSPGCVTEVASFAPGEYIPEDNQYLVYQGERIVSFREMLRRYHWHNVYFPAGVGTNANNRKVCFNLHNFPFYRGWEPSGQDTATSSTGTDGYNFVSETLLNYLTPAFACRRGCLRHKMIYTSYGAAARMGTMTATRHNLTGANISETAHDLNGVNGDRRSEMLETEMTGLGGSHTTAVFNNPVLEYETPYYTNGQRFEPARFVGRYNAFDHGHELAVDVVGGTTSDDVKIDHYISIGEDFQLGMFTGAPIMYAYADPVPVT